MPILVMDYITLGNLHEQHMKVARITNQEVIVMLDQLLRALGHLHFHGVVHRDVKPENILIQSRGPRLEPSHFWVKLGDFSLSNDSSSLKTFCGTKRYVAPEVRPGSHYTPAVDIWSLGIVIFEYGYGLPPDEKGQDWYEVLMRRVQNWDPDRLLDLLSTSMLQMDPQRRHSASECSKKASELLIATPRQSLEDDLGTPTEMTPTSVLMEAIRHLNEPNPMTDVHVSILPSARKPVEFPMQGLEPSAIETVRSISEKRQRSPATASSENTPPSKLQKHPKRPSVPLGIKLRTVENFYFLDTGRCNIAVRIADLWVNANHLLKEALQKKYRRDVVASLRAEGARFEFVRGRETQGTYMDFSMGIELCEKYDLRELKTFLESLKETLKSINRKLPRLLSAVSHPFFSHRQRTQSQM